MNRCLVIFMGTGKYWELARDAILNWRTQLDNDGYLINYLLLTDKHEKCIFIDKQPDVTVRHCPKLPFPLPTLLRYHFFLENQDILENYDYVFFANADMRIVGKWSIKELLPQEGYNLVGVAHPGFYLWEESEDDRTGYPDAPPRQWGVWEDKRTCAYRIPPYIGYRLTEYYLIGAFQGGKKDSFIKMCNVLKDQIETDLKKNHIPEWHDETMKNWYAQYNEKFQCLPPTYCQPEIKDNDWPLFGPGPTKILKLRKDHAQIRS